MADYIYTMESRLSPEQMRTVNTVQQIARSHGMNVYLTGGAIRDILTGFPIRDLDFTVQGNPLDFQGDIRDAGGILDMVDPTFCVIHAVFQGTRAEIGMARAEVFDKPGTPPAVKPATITEDLRRRDFTFNAMALSLNDGSRGLLLDPFNGAADIEARLVRVLHSYAFLEDPSRLIRATRFATRFGWELEERTQARYDSAREGDYIHFLGSHGIGYEIEQIAYEEDPIGVMRALESEGWLRVLCSKWTAEKADVPELSQLLKTRTSLTNLNISVDAAPAVMHFLTAKLSSSEVSAIQRLIPHREFVANWNRLDHESKELSKKLLSKDAALNSGAWKILESAKPEALLFLEATGTNKTADEKVKNYFGKWRQVQDLIPVAKMAELRITPQLPEYAQICQEAFLLLLDGKLRSESEVMKFLAPFEPPPPPPPPTPVRRGRANAKKVPAQAAKAAAQSSVTTHSSEVAVISAPEHPKALVVEKHSLGKNHSSPLNPLKKVKTKFKSSLAKSSAVAAKPLTKAKAPAHVSPKKKLTATKPSAKATVKRAPAPSKKAVKPKLAARIAKATSKKAIAKKPSKKLAPKKSTVQKSSKLKKKNSKRH